MVGQHIRILKGGKWVHAVDCGDETVLHLVEEAPPPRVRRAYRPEFVAGAEAVEVVTHRERTFPAREIVRRAYSRASDPALAAMFQDSESFVEWCTTGRLATPRNVALEVPGVAPAPAPAPKSNGEAGRPRELRKPRKVVRAKARPAAKAKAAPAKPKRAARAKAARKSKPAATARPAARSQTKAKPAARKAAPRKAAARKAVKRNARR